MAEAGKRVYPLAQADSILDFYKQTEDLMSVLEEVRLERRAA